jgi:predicted short-subunit dehydrogenase-like oxidoreductase (DUF2520 family)
VTIGILGTGKVGRSIDEALIAQPDTMHFAVRHLTDAPFVPDLLLLCVPDSQLNSVAHDVAVWYTSTSTTTNTQPRCVVAHTAGAFTPAVLASCDVVGMHAAAMHPFQTFARADASVLDGIAWGVECSDEDAALCIEAVRLLGGTATRLTNMTPERKRIYHAAAVAASNHLYAAIGLARAAAHEAGIPEQHFLMPIMHRTLVNAGHALRDSEPLPVTGPLVRGDVDGVREQLQALPPALREPYAALSIALLAVIRHHLDPAVVQQLQRVLEERVDVR